MNISKWIGAALVLCVSVAHAQYIDMTTLNAASPISGTDLFPCNQPSIPEANGQHTHKCTAAQLQTFIGAGGGFTAGGDLTGTSTSQTVVPGAITPAKTFFSPESQSPSSTCSNPSPGTTDVTACVQAAINAAAAAGGGVVNLSNTTYYVPGGLSLTQSNATGVTIQGQGCSLNSSTFLYQGGTRLKGAGTNPIFSFLPTTYSSQPTALQAVAEGLYSFSVKDACLDGGTYGLQFGSRYNSGLWYGSTIKNVFVLNSTVWGTYCENCSEFIFDGVHVINNASGATGSMYFGASQSGYNNGNAMLRHVFANGNKASQRGIVFQAYASSNMNGINGYDVQDIQLGATYSQSATMSNASANITVSDGTKFPLDMPVTFTTSANGFVQYETYWVVSNSSNVIQIAAKPRGVAITPTSNSAITIETFGFPGLEIEGFDYHNDSYASGTTNSSVGSVSFNGVDVEQNGTCLVALSNAYGNFDFNLILSSNAQGTGLASSVCARGASGTWRVGNPIYYDGDNSSSYAFFAESATLSSVGTATIQWVPTGMYKDKNSFPSLNIAPTSSIPSLNNWNVSGSGVGSGNFLYPGAGGMGQKVTTINYTTAVTLNPAEFGEIVFSATDPGKVITLPPLDNVAPNNGAAWAGAEYEIINAQSGYVTVNADASNGKYFDSNPNLTSYTIQPYGSLKIRASFNATSNVSFWAVESSFNAIPGNAFTLGTGTGACATTSTLTGTQNTGSFLCTGTAGASTQPITLPTAKNGWACSASDVTSGVVWAQSATSTTGCTVSGTIATTSDKVVFQASPY